MNNGSITDEYIIICINIKVEKNNFKKSSATREPQLQPRCYLCPLAHFKKSTDWVEGSGAADVQVCLVVGLQDPDEVITLPLKKKPDIVH